MKIILPRKEVSTEREAITLHEQTLAARERVLGPDHPDTLTSRNNLALAHQDAGRTGDAGSKQFQACRSIVPLPTPAVR
jgi:hypothetical protein